MRKYNHLEIGGIKMLHKVRKWHLPQVMLRTSWAMKVTLLITCSLVVLIAGCSKQAENVMENTSDSKVELKFIWWGNDTRKEITEKVIALYESENPHVKIQTEVVSGTDLLAKNLAIYTARQEMPDIIQTDYSFVFNYITRDLIEPVDAYVGEELQLS